MLTHWKRLWCWEGLGAGGEGDYRGWDGWMASPTRWTWVWVNSGSWWWTGRPGVLQFMGLQRVGHNWATELNWTEAVCAFWMLTSCQLHHLQIFFYQSIGCLVISSTVFFAMQKLISLIRNHLFIFAFVSFVLGDRSKKYCYDLSQRMFCLCSLLEVL